MATGIIALLTALAGVVLAILRARQASQERANNARAQAARDAMAHADLGDVDGAVNDVLGMPDR